MKSTKLQLLVTAVAVAMAALLAAIQGAPPRLGLDFAIATHDIHLARRNLRWGRGPNGWVTYRPNWCRDDYPFTVGASSWPDVTPLHLAVIRGDPDMVRLLLRWGADPSALDENRIAPLVIAAFRQDTALCRLLLDAGADPDGSTRDAVAPLTEALRADERGSLPVVKFLLERGADPDRSDRDMTPLYEATSRGLDRTARLLLDHGARIDIHTACAMGRTDLVEAMLSDRPALL